MPKISWIIKFWKIKIKLSRCTDKIGSFTGMLSAQFRIKCKNLHRHYAKPEECSAEYTFRKIPGPIKNLQASYNSDENFLNNNRWRETLGYVHVICNRRNVPSIFLSLGINHDSICWSRVPETVQTVRITPESMGSVGSEAATVRWQYIYKMWQ